MCVCFMGTDNNNIVLIHLARAADALEHTQEDDEPGSQEAQGQGPPDRAWVMKALTVYYTQHPLTARNTKSCSNVYYSTPTAKPDIHQLTQSKQGAVSRLDFMSIKKKYNY